MKAYITEGGLNEMLENIQSGYYPLKTLSGAPNGYVCLTYLSQQLEVRVRIDHNPENNACYQGYFTGHLASLPGDFAAIQLQSGEKERTVCGSETFPLSQWTPIEGSIDFTLFHGSKPILTATLYTAPEKPTAAPPQAETASEPAPPEPNMQPSNEVDNVPDSEPDSEALLDPEALPDAALSIPNEFPGLTQFDPFNTTNAAYQWWLCQSTQDFHDVMGSTGIVPHPPLYTALNSALVRFSHFLVGRYQENEEDVFPGRLLYILGVPVAENGALSEQNNARWMPAQNKVTGNFRYTGYWLYYFDAATGKPVRAVIRQ